MLLSVVIADDDLDYLYFVRSLIASAPDMMTVVGEAADGEAALAMVLRERAEIVITDLVMPHLDGLELTRRVRQELPQTIIILMSSHTEDAYRLLASDSGADAFVNKQVLRVVSCQRSATSSLGGCLEAAARLPQIWVRLHRSLRPPNDAHPFLLRVCLPVYPLRYAGPLLPIGCLRS